MNVVAITTCVNYSDHLVWLARSLRGWISGLVVVTEQDDAAFEVCRRINATPILFGGWRDRGASFNRAGAIRYAQEIVYASYPDHWYLLVDADCVLPENAAAVIEKEATNQSAIYLARRVDFHTPNDLAAGLPTKTYGGLGAGYFQLYKQHVLYPEWSANAAECDLVFASQFPSAIVLSMTVGHCGEEGRNWCGRTSPLWIMTEQHIKQMNKA